MDRNPYSPPESPVSEVAGVPTEVNDDVLLACKLLWVQFGLSLVSTTGDLFSLTSTAEMVGVAIGSIIGIGMGVAITLWVVSKLKAGRNWMRLFMTVGAVIGWLTVVVFWKFYVSNVFPLYAGRPIKIGAYLLSIIVSTWSVVLLNTPRSRAWFSAKKRRTPDVA